MISIDGAVRVILYLLVAGLIFWLLHFLINYINPPEPFKKVALIVLMVLGVLVVISVLLSMIGGVPIFRP